MLLQNLLNKILRDVGKSSDGSFYRGTTVEIDNPISESKFEVPVFEIVTPSKPDYVDLPAKSFSLQTLLTAGVSLTPSTIVTSSFLRETEKFMDKLNSH